jgi:SSS family solute:Na+ symporter
MLLIDWILVFIPLLIVLGFALYTNRYVKGVADFLSGGRCAGRYLLANAKGEADSGLASTMSRFEIFLVSGFVVTYWEKLTYPIVLLVAISGFVLYRFRETRALTLAQFFEIRYSRNFRLFMGALAFLGGILNFGIFPAVNARFFVYFLDLPQTLDLHLFHISTFALIMLIYLVCTVTLVLIGGQATIMIACCLEGIFSQFVYILLAIVILCIVRWHFVAGVMTSQPPGHSFVNPLDASKVRDFNMWFILMGMFTRVYSTMASQQQRQGFYSAAKTPHESRMGQVLGEWRTYAGALMILVLTICSVTYLRDPYFAAASAPIKTAIGSIQSTYLQQQLTVPIALRFLLPPGVKGLFCAIMVMGFLSADGGHMHSWGSILVQDFILPLTRITLSPKAHIWAIRSAIIGVACFAFCFSMFFPQTEYIFLWMLVTGAVFSAGAGAAIIGGLYWKRGTAAAAWSASIAGSALCLIGIACGAFWPNIYHVLNQKLGIPLPKEFWFNYQVSGFIAQVTAATVYIVVSLLTSRRAINLDRMLHRGEYTLSDESPGSLLPGDPAPKQRHQQIPTSLRQRFTLRNVFKFDENFTPGDKVISGAIFWWSMILVVVNAAIIIWSFAVHGGLSNQWWANYWLILAIQIPFAVSIITFIWFSIGGFRDIRDFFKALKHLRRDARDDGRVEGHHNLADEPGRGFEVSAEGKSLNSK